MSIDDLTSREPLTPLPEPAERVRLREAFGISQERLARSLGVRRRTVCMWETGQAEPAGENRDNYAAVLYAWQEGNTSIEPLPEPAERVRRENMSIDDLTSREPLAPLPEPAERVRLREAFGITQYELAKALHVNRRTIFMWETGQAEPAGENRDNYAAVLYAWQDKIRTGGKRK